jgi:8-amino-7-oxononanoate synthase
VRPPDSPEPDPFFSPEPDRGDSGRSSDPGWGRRRNDRWLERWMGTTQDLARLQYSHRMLDAVIDEIDGRDVRIADRWLTDYSSSNYLGLDLDEEIIYAVPEYLARWGTRPGWPRLLGSPVLYEEIETRLTALLGAEDALVLPTITHIHIAAIPVLAGGGTIFLDDRAPAAIADGCALAEARGATVRTFAHDDPDGLQALLYRDWRRPGMICMEGVDGATGTPGDVPALLTLAREHEVLLYIDDAHGFGVLGDRSPAEWCPYGMRGNGIVRHAGESYDNVVLAADLSHAYSTPLAFIACSTPIKQLLKTAASPYLHCGPAPVAALATALEGLRVNDARGDRLRARVHRLTRRVLNRVTALELAAPPGPELPILHLPLADPSTLDQVADTLFDAGVYAAIAVHPLAPRDEAGIRIRITAAHSEEQIDHLSLVLRRTADRFKLRHAPAD